MTFTSDNPANGPSTWATSVCFANGSLDATQYCGPTGYPAGEAGDFLFAGKTAGGGNVTSVAPAGGGLWVTAGASNSTTIVNTRHIAALNYLTGNPTVYLSGVTVYQTSGSTQTVRIQTFSNTDAYSHSYGAANTNITSTTDYAIPSGVATVVPITSVAAKSFWIGFPTSIVFGVNNFQLSASDTVAPTVTSITRNSPTTSPTADDTVTWRVAFNEAVQNVDATDFQVSGTTAGLAVAAVSTSVYDVTASGGDLANLNGTVTLSFASGQNITDTSSNALSATTPTGTNDNTFVMQQDTSSPTVQILNAPPGISNRAPFSVTVQFSEDVTGFVVGDITVGNGAASNFVAVDADTYTADITPSGVGDVTIDVNAGVAQDAASNPNLAATQVSVTCGAGCGAAATVARTRDVIRHFTGNRIRLITAQGPGISGFLTGDGMDGTINGLVASPVAVNIQGGLANGSGGFSTSLQQMKGFAQGLSAEQESPAVTEPVAPPVNVWIKGRWTKSSDDRGGVNDETDFGIIYLGADYRASNDLLIGVLAQYDWFDERSSGLNMAAEGQGWMVGPYIVTRLKDAMTMDLRVAWGQSDNKVRPVGTYQDRYDAERWQVEGNVVGSFTEKRTRIELGLGLNYFEETQQQYVDSNGFVIPSQSVGLGTLSFGPVVTYLADGHDGSYVHPFVTAKGIWDFEAPDRLDVNGVASGVEKLRAQLGAGVKVSMAGGTRIQASYTYDGIGASGYEAHSAELSASLNMERSGMPKGARLDVSYALQNIVVLHSDEAHGARLELSIPFH